jgi:ribonuclease BN (tRNA processing enzyme)
MRLTVLGAGPAYTDRPGATGASYLVSSGDTHVLLDLGQGSLPRLFAAIPPTSLAAVAISHLHPDHFIDLVALRHYLRWEFHPPRRVRVLGPSGLAERLDALHGEPGFAAASFDTERLGTSERCEPRSSITPRRAMASASPPTPAGRAWYTAGTAAAGRILRRCSSRATPCSVRSRSDRVRSCRTCPTSTGRRSGCSRPHAARDACS